LISCSRDATLRVWDSTKDHANTHVVNMGGSRALSCYLQPYPSMLAAVTLGNNRIALVDLAEKHPRPRMMSGHAGRVTHVSFWKNFLISSSVDHSLRVWDIHSASCILALKAHQDSVNGFVHDGDVVYSCSDDGTLRVWRLADLGIESMVAQGGKHKSGKLGSVGRRRPTKK
jgi:WD40 repeat protein